MSNKDRDDYRSLIEHKIHAFKDVISNDSRVDNLDKILYNAEMLGEYSIIRANISGDIQKMSDMYRFCVYKHLEDWMGYIKTLPENTHKVTPVMMSIDYMRTFYDELISPHEQKGDE